MRFEFLKNRLFLLMMCLVATAGLIVSVVQNKSRPAESASGGEESLTPPPKSSSPPTPPVDNQDWAHILINKKHPITHDFSIETVPIDDVPVDIRVAPYLNSLINEAKSQGINLGICSGYRNIQYQKKLYEKEIEKFMNQGLNREEAEAEAARHVARPGESEHHSGLAIDFYTYDEPEKNLTSDFLNTKQGRFLDKNAYKKGFLQRYPLGKEDVTGYTDESWHYRFVGDDAEKIKNSGLTFDEYWEKYYSRD
ncbi:MAG: M15 family metallopeptidase [Oscillospiraceae bacterium]|jgi:D-alanyl-D-alanine carboxypeptidase|nr:M15 family metallopeptidase [Oscillospiraceae bacterium]